MTYNSDRLNQIEQLLATPARSYVEFAQCLELINEGLERTKAGLEGTKAGLERINEGLERTNEGLERTWQICESNTRRIEAWGDRIDEGIAKAEEVNSQDSATVGPRTSDLDENTRVDRVRYDQLHKEHTLRFNNLLEEARADRQRAERDREAFQQRMDEALAKAARDREAADRDLALNDSEHQVFLETVQTMLAEISRLRQQEAD